MHVNLLDSLTRYIPTKKIHVKLLVTVKAITKMGHFRNDLLMYT